MIIGISEIERGTFLMVNKHKTILFFGLLVIVLGACAPLAASSSSEESTVTTPPEIEPTNTAAPSEHSRTAEECEDPFAGSTVQFSTRFWEGRTNFCLNSVSLSEFLSGGPPPDGIPAIDEPIFETVEEADAWLEEDWPVMFFEWNGEARAYPLAILIWHEIVNDIVGGEPVSLTFCPLCNATIAFRRTQPDGQVLDFGTTGNLRNSDLVMYDRQTFSWWQQFTGEAIVGEMTGMQLEVLPSQIIAWSDFKAAHPDADVLSRSTGHVRNYGRNPYAGYDSINSSPFALSAVIRADIDDRLVPMERVVAIELGGQDIAFPFSQLSEIGVVNDNIGDTPIVVLWQEGTKSIFGNNGADTGSTGVFLRELDGERLTFLVTKSGFEDQETGSNWNILGEAVAGPLAGAQLERVVSAEHFWFAWVVFKPDTIVWSPS
jgi:hypothetical protein